MLKPGVKHVGGRVKAVDLVAMIRSCGGLASCGPLLDLQDAVIEGDLILDDAQAAVSGPVGAMMFIGCTFEGNVISLRSSHIQRLCFQNCRFTVLDIEDAQIESSLTLEGVRGLDVAPDASSAEDTGKAGLCRVKAARSRIDGDVVCKHAQLNEGVRDKDDPSHAVERRLYALCLEEADITGSVYCESSVLLGGLNLKNADLRGDLWVINAHLEGREGPALFMQGASVGGGVVLRRETSACGEGSPGWRPDMDRPLDLISVDKDSAALDVFSARVGSSFYVENCVIDGVSGGDGRAIYVAGLILTGSLNIWESRVLGWIDVRAARIGSSVEVGRAETAVTTVGHINLDHAQIEGALNIHAVFDGNILYEGGDIRGVDLKTGGRVNLSGRIRTGFDFSSARLGGELRLGADGQALVFRAQPTASADSVAQRLLFKEAALDGGLEIGGIGIVLTEPMDLASLKALRVEGMRLPFYRDPVWRLVATWPLANGRTAALSALGFQVDGKPTVTLLSGQSAIIHAFNEAEGGGSRLVLDTAEKAADYAALFCDDTWGDGGSFRLIRSPGDRAVARLGKRSWRALTARLRELDRIARLREGVIEQSQLGVPWKSPGTGRWHLITPIEYDNSVFVSELAVRDNGEIDMLQDEPVAGLDPDLTITFRSPVRILPPATQARAVFALAPLSQDGFDADLWGDALRAAIVEHGMTLQGLGRQPGLTEINLSGARLYSLEDRGGTAWEGLRPFQLNLTGFTLGRVIDDASPEKMSPPPRQGLSDKMRWGDLWKRLGPRASRRLVWLSHQFTTPEDRFEHPRTHHADRIPPFDSYSPEPYFEFARVLTQSGHVDDARRVESYSRTLQLKARALRDRQRASRGLAERAETAVLTFGGYLLHKTSDYFMSMGRAAATFAAVYAIGVGATLTGLWSGILVQDVSPVASVMVSNGERAEFALPKVDGAIAPGHLSCGTSINPFVYPLDMMLPLDLGHKNKCDIKTPVVQIDSGPAWTTAAAQLATDVLFGALKLSKALYVLMGWLSLTLVVVTATNVFRRHGGRG